MQERMLWCIFFENDTNKSYFFILNQIRIIFIQAQLLVENLKSSFDDAQKLRRCKVYLRPQRNTVSMSNFVFILVIVSM